MSSIFIRDIIGTGTYAVPSSDAALAAATSGLSTLIGGVAGLAVGNVSAWVTTGTGSTPRELNASVANVQYNGELCPDATETAAMLAAIEAALIADPNITSVTLQAANLENVPAGPAVPTSHASSHENGGADEISVAGLSGALADAQIPASRGQTVTVAKSNGDYTSLTAALAAITDASSSKPYTIELYPGIYAEAPLTMKAYVAIHGIDVSSCIIAATNNASPLLTAASNSSIRSLSINGPTSDSGVLVGSGVSNVFIENVSFLGGQEAVKATGASAACVMEECKIFPSVGIGVFAQSSGRVDCSNILGYATTLFQSDNGTIWIHNSGGISNTNGIYAVNGGLIYPNSVTFENTTYPVRTGSGSNEISGNSVVSRGTSTEDVRQESSGSIITLTGSRLDDSKFNIADYEDINVTFDTTDQEQEAQVSLIQMDIGSPELGRHLYSGQGRTYTRGMIVITSDSTAGPASDGGNLTDVSVQARSKQSSTFSFQGTAVNHTIIIGSRLQEASDLVKHFGIVASQTTAASEVTPKSFVFEYWNGSAWVEFNVFAVEEDDQYRYGNEVFIRSNITEVIRFGLSTNTPWVKKSILGNNLYWTRIRISTGLTTAPVFEQFKIVPCQFVVHENGFVAYNGLARFRETLQSAGDVFGEEGGGGVTSFGIAVGSGGVPTGWTHNIKNSGLNSNGDAINYQAFIPKGLDTSQPIFFEACLNVFASSGAGTATLIASLLPVEIEGTMEADPTGGKTPVARTIANTETLAAKAAQIDTETLDTSVGTKLRRLTFGPFDISDYYEGDLMFVRFEMDDDGASNSDIGIVAVEINGVRWANGESAA